MNYNEPAVLWQKRNQRYPVWEDSLLNNAEKLRGQVEEVLRPPAEGLTHGGWKVSTGVDAGTELTHMPTHK